MIQPPRIYPEPKSIGRFIDDGHPWMALTVTLIWLSPVGFGPLAGAAFVLRHLF